jgi:hypothetical protein
MAPASYQGTQFEGEGTIANISTSGALIEPASATLAPGTQLDLRIARPSASSSLAIPSEVVRETDSGFAVRFRQLDPEVLELVRELLPARGTDHSPTPGSAAASLERFLSRLESLCTGIGHLREIGRSVVTLPGRRSPRPAMAVSDFDLGTLTGLRSRQAISTVPTLSRINTGSLHINRVSILINVRSDSLNDVIVSINTSGARATASFNAITNLVSITANSNGENLVLEDGTSRFFSGVNIVPGTYEPREGPPTPDQRILSHPAALGDQLEDFGKELEKIFSWSFDGVEEGLLFAIRKALATAIAESFSEIPDQTDPSILDSGLGICFDFRNVNCVFALDRRCLYRALVEDFDKLSDFLFRERSSGEKAGLVPSLIEAVKNLERLLEDVLGGNRDGMSVEARA